MRISDCFNSSKPVFSFEYLLPLRGISGIENVLALRGDPPKGQKVFVAHDNGFSYGIELVRFIREKYSFCLCAAAYPEGHLETTDKEADLRYLKKKVDAGADFLITQLFFDSRDYFRF